MKKILLFVLVALVAVALVACGGEDTTAPTTTENPGTTTTAAPGGNTTTEDPGTTTEPTTPDTDDPGEELSGYDLVEELFVIDPWDEGTMVFFTFEDTHGSLDFHPAVVFKMNNSNQVYEELFITDRNEDGSWNTDSWKANDEFTWYFIVDDEKIECKRFSLFNSGDSGYVRADLGADFSYDDYEYDADGIHNYSVQLEIYDSLNELVYYGDLTSYAEYAHTKPAKIEMIEDTDRTITDRVPASVVIGESGPDTGNGEGFKNLFDNDVRSKLCTGNNGFDHGIVISFETAQKISGISLVNANDNQGFNGRTVVAFDIYVSTDGQNWGDAPVVSFDGLDADGNAIDKSTISTNYAENYFDFGKVLENVQNIKLVVNNGETYQISELIFWLG